jgi:hypothetical protein
MEDLMRFKNDGVSGNPKVANEDLDSLVFPLGLSDVEIGQLIAFMNSLTDHETVKDPLFLAPDRVPSGLEIPR